MKAIAKWMVALLVAVGLYFATRQAMEQWQTESAQIQEQIDRIGAELSDVTDPVQRQRLVEAQNHWIATMPTSRNLRWDRIAWSALTYALALIPPSFLLRRAVMALGQQVRIGTCVAAQLLGHVGKYVPGKAMVIVLRAGGLANDGVPPLVTTLAVFIETFVVMAVGAAVAGLVVLWLPVPTWITAMAFMFAVAASLPTLPAGLRRVASRVSDLPADKIHSSIDFRLVAFGWGLALFSWLLFGASFAWLIAAIPSTQPLPPSIELYGIATAAASLAMVVGFASLLPGGAGVRELVLAAVLGVSLGPAHGLFAAVAHRVLSISVESILAAGSWLWLRSNGSPEVFRE